MLPIVTKIELLVSKIKKTAKDTQLIALEVLMSRSDILLWCAAAVIRFIGLVGVNIMSSFCVLYGLR